MPKYANFKFLILIAGFLIALINAIGTAHSNSLLSGIPVDSEITDGMILSSPPSQFENYLETREYDLAIKYLTNKASNNDLSAHHNLGIIFFRGIGVAPDLDKAFRHFRAASDAPHLFYGSYTYMVRIAQIRLLELGLDAGKVDGDIGPKTRSAINQLYGDVVLSDDGLSANIELLERIVFGDQENFPQRRHQNQFYADRKPISNGSSAIPHNILYVDRANKKLTPIEIFQKTSGSIYVIYARSNSITTKNRQSQGSAVAISSSLALTNCHVLENSKEAFLKSGDEYSRIDVIYSDKKTDRCVIRSRDITLQPIEAIRRKASLSIGEKTYSIGAPRGLEKTLGDGLVSGIRTGPVTYIQTSAPISPGSSGGGLFDEEGSLIGITTFLLKESQSLNFAISAEEYPLKYSESSR